MQILALCVIKFLHSVKFFYYNLARRGVPKVHRRFRLLSEAEVIGTEEDERERSTEGELNPIFWTVLCYHIFHSDFNWSPIIQNTRISFIIKIMNISFKFFKEFIYRIKIIKIKPLCF